MPARHLGRPATSAAGGKRRRRRLPREAWISFIPGAHPGFVTLDQCDAKPRRLAANAAAHAGERAGPPREGAGLCRASSSTGPAAAMTIRPQRRAGKCPPTPAGGRHLHAAGSAMPSPAPASTSRSGTPDRDPHRRSRSRRLRRRRAGSRAANTDALRAATSSAPAAPPTWPAPLPRRRPPPARRRHPRSRLEHRPARARRARHLRAGPRPARRTAHRRPETPDRASWPPTSRDIARYHHPRREHKRIARLLLTDFTVTRTHDTITAHVRLRGRPAPTLTLPPRPPAWSSADPRQPPSPPSTSSSTTTSSRDRRRPRGARGLTNGEGRPSTPLVVRDHRDTYGYAAARSGSATPACSRSARWPRGSGCPPQP